MSKAETLSLDQAAEELNTTVDQVKLMTKRDQLEAVFEDGEAFITKQSVMEFQGETYAEEDAPELISKKEAADILGISEASVYGYGNAGKIKKVDGRYDKQSVLGYKAQRDANKRPLRTAKADAIPRAKTPMQAEEPIDTETTSEMTQDELVAEHSDAVESHLNHRLKEERSEMAREWDEMICDNMGKIIPIPNIYSKEHIKLIKENERLKGKLEVIEKIYPELKGITHGSI